MFFTFRQNYSGGYFITNKEHGVSEYIIIEAPNSDEAIETLEYIGSKVSDFFDYCSCCGERWTTWIEDEDGTERPEIYGNDVFSLKESYYRKRCYIHYINGEVKEIEFEEVSL